MSEHPIEQLVKEAIKPLEKKMIELGKIMQDTDIKPLSFKKSQMNKLLKPIEDFIRNLEQTRFLDKYDSFSQAYLDMQLKNAKTSICILRGENPQELKDVQNSIMKTIIFNEMDLLKDFIEVHFETRERNLIRRLCEKYNFNIEDTPIMVFSLWDLKLWIAERNVGVSTAKEIHETFQKYVRKS